MIDIRKEIRANEKIKKRIATKDTCLGFADDEEPEELYMGVAAV